jgi:selenocysteine-specific elongation factor
MPICTEAAVCGCVIMADSASEPADAGCPTSILNVNVGILGHVDSGKTSLVRALSTLLSTAALDKNPQSQERGITLDLGFSAFVADIPEHLSGCGYSQLQFTLVDCPGHASLIKTIIGGAQIIDMMILVIDIVKGIQTQTAECLVVGEITTDNLIVVLNKVDLLPEEGRDKEIERITGRIRKVLASTKFAAAPFVVLSASPGGAGKLGAATAVGTVAEGTKLQSGTVAELVAVMRSRVQIPHRDGDGPFLFAIDHCFPIKGQGTVMTGTVLSGSCKLNDVVELPDLRQEKKVKSMQMFKKAVSRIREGDRAGICVAGLDASLVERGLACTPGTGMYCWFLYSITLHSNILACSGSSTRCYSAGSESKVFQRCWGF